MQLPNAVSCTYLTISCITVSPNPWVEIDARKRLEQTDINETYRRNSDSNCNLKASTYGGWSHAVPSAFSRSLGDLNAQFFVSSIAFTRANVSADERVEKNRSQATASMSRSFGARWVARNVEECEM